MDSFLISDCRVDLVFEKLSDCRVSTYTVINICFVWSFFLLQNSFHKVQCYSNRSNIHKKIITNLRWWNSSIQRRISASCGGGGGRGTGARTGNRQIQDPRHATVKGLDTNNNQKSSVTLYQSTTNLHSNTQDILPISNSSSLLLFYKTKLPVAIWS